MLVHRVACRLRTSSASVSVPARGPGTIGYTGKTRAKKSANRPSATNHSPTITST